MEIRGSEFIALATDGDVRLGGYDWDQRLVDLVAESFRREHGFDPREDPATAGRAVAGMRRRQADALRPQQGPGGLRISRRHLADRNYPRAVRGGHAGPAGPHAIHRACRP